VAAACCPPPARRPPLTLRSDQLGDYIYTLGLRASPAGPEHPLQLAAPLGSAATATFRFRHFDARPGVYQCTVSRPDLFSVPPTVRVAPPAPAAGAGAAAAAGGSPRAKDKEAAHRDDKPGGGGGHKEDKAAAAAARGRRRGRARPPPRPRRKRASRPPWTWCLTAWPSATAPRS
jgi:hypothetical protein